MRKITPFQKVMSLILMAVTVTIAAADDGRGKDGLNTGEVRLRAKLAGPSIQNRKPEGSGDFRTNTNVRTRLNVEVENVNLPAGTVLTVAILHGGSTTPAGTITLSTTGFGELELESQNGATVPAVETGDMLAVSNAGVTILAGVFGTV